MTVAREPGPRAEPQPVLGPPSEAAIFLVVTIDPGAQAVVRDLLADVAGLQRAVGFRVPAGGLSCVVGVGSEAWDRLFSGPRPAELHPFRDVIGERHHAVSPRETCSFTSAPDRWTFASSLRPRSWPGWPDRSR